MSALQYVLARREGGLPRLHPVPRNALIFSTVAGTFSCTKSFLLIGFVLGLGASNSFSFDSSESFKIIYHEGPVVKLNAKADSGRLGFAPNSIVIQGAKVIEINFKSINSLEWTTMPGSGHMIKVGYDQGTIYISVVRINVLGYFVVVNRQKTSELYEFLMRKLLKLEILRGKAKSKSP